MSISKYTTKYLGFRKIKDIKNGVEFLTSYGGRYYKSPIDGRLIDSWAMEDERVVVNTETLIEMEVK